MRTRYQEGSLRLKKALRGPDQWIFRWRERCDGVVRHRSRIIGTVLQYHTRTAAQKACGHIRLAINQRPLDHVVHYRDVIDRYIEQEAPRRFSTRHSYLSYLNNYIRPRWGAEPLPSIKPLAVRDWLLQLDLSGKTRGHIKALMVRLFDCAMLWELVPFDRNPMQLVRLPGVTRRRKKPRVLSIAEFEQLLAQLTVEPFRTMVLLDACTGLRCSELLALRWCDFDWQRRELCVERGIVCGHVDAVKTEYSRERIPLDSDVITLMASWREQSPWNRDDDWVFASPHHGGEMPYRSWGVQQRRLCPAAKTAGLGTGIGWHTLRHSYKSWLGMNGTAMAVQKDLMRHASITTTMDVYGAAQESEKRAAHSGVVRMVLKPLTCVSVPQQPSERIANQ